MSAKLATEQDIETLLLNTIGVADIDGSMDLADLDQWQSYEEAAVFSSNRGIVLRTRSGAEFQLTIVRSR